MPVEISTAFLVLGTVNNVLIMTIGNLLHYGIIQYEHYGGDPQKRTMSNKMISFSCYILILHTMASAPVLETFLIYGIVPAELAQLIEFVRSFGGVSVTLALTESILFKCFVVFGWRFAASVQDDFFAVFFVAFNIIASGLIMGIHIFLGNINQMGYGILTGTFQMPSEM